MKRDNHYEVAFEAYLRDRAVSFVAVDEARRTLLRGDESLKSLDFIIVGPTDARLVIDVKGRKFPGGPPEKPSKCWQSWSTREDVAGLQRWATLLGPSYRGLLVFAYHIQPPYQLPVDTPDLWHYREQTYLFRAVAVDVYRDEMRCRSPRWGTVDLPVQAFRRVIRPFHEFLEPVLV